MNLAALKKVTRNLHFYVGEEVPDNLVNFTYYPNKITPEWQEKWSNLDEETSTSDDFLSSLADIIDSWDILDVPAEEGGTFIPFKKENLQTGKEEVNLMQLKGIPFEIYTLLMQVINEDQKPKKEQQIGSLIG